MCNFRQKFGFIVSKYQNLRPIFTEARKHFGKMLTLLNELIVYEEQIVPIWNVQAAEGGKYPPWMPEYVYNTCL